MTDQNFRVFAKRDLKVKILFKNQVEISRKRKEECQIN